MPNAYVTALIDSLNKKIEILEEIHKKDEEQFLLASISPFPFKDFDRNAEEKSVLIYKLNKLDDGFEKVYEEVKAELNGNKEAYKAEIKTMQELITKIQDLSVKIQAEEARNKAKMESAFKFERSKIKQQRSSIKAIKSYTQAMQAGKQINQQKIST